MSSIMNYVSGEPVIFSRQWASNNKVKKKRAKLLAADKSPQCLGWRENSFAQVGKSSSWLRMLACQACWKFIDCTGSTAIFSGCHWGPPRWASFSVSLGYVPFGAAGILGGPCTTFFFLLSLILFSPYIRIKKLLVKTCESQLMLFLHHFT